MGFVIKSRWIGAESFLTLVVLFSSSLVALGALICGRDKIYGPFISEQIEFITELGNKSRTKAWLIRNWGVFVILSATFLSAQTWFAGGNSVAGGDLSPPNGFSWVGSLFAPWVWNGTNLGGPGTFQSELPWASLLEIVHFIGLSSGFAERAWCTAAFVLAGLAVYFSLRSFGLRTVGSLFGALVYCYNPFVLTNVGPNPLYLATLAIIPLFVLTVLAIGERRISVWIGILIFSLSTPFIGYAFINPPLAVMAAGSIILTPILVWFLWGKRAFVRTLNALVIAIPLMLLLSLYWIVPQLISIKGAATGELSSISSWTWTEIRSQLNNSFWLNTTWAWGYPSSFPYAKSYGQLPLRILRYFIPAASFLALALAQHENVSYRRKILAVIGAVISLFFVLLANGTLFPGRLIFNFLYSLPLGWLLREPGKLLFFAGFGYALLIGITVELTSEIVEGLAWPQVRVFGFIEISKLKSIKFIMGVCLALLIGFTTLPMVDGSFVAKMSNAQSQTYSHVTLPTYWTTMSTYVNRRGSNELLMMPPDDFYQMPYSWGYYGADGFLVDLFSKKVIDPNGQGYYPGQPNIISAVSLFAGYVLSHKWLFADEILRSLGANEVLLRGDIVSPFPGRSIIAPKVLLAALRIDPYLDLVKTYGPLVLLKRTTSSLGLNSFVMDNSKSPSLTDLTLLPKDSAIVSGNKRAGIPYIVELPLSAWSIVGNVASVDVPEFSDWTYSLISNGNPVSVSAMEHGTSRSDKLNVTLERGSRGSILRLQEDFGARLLSDGNFTHGLWQNIVGDCNNADGTVAAQSMVARIVPRAGPESTNALDLSTRYDTACESRSIAWTSGSVIVNFSYRNLRGGAPSICVYAIGPNECLPTGALSNTKSWTTYRSVVTPPANTHGLALFLYSGDLVPGSLTDNQYARVSVYSISFFSRIDVLANPISKDTSPVALIESFSSYSKNWQGPSNGLHVILDGMKNGWLVPEGSKNSVKPYYSLSSLVEFSSLASLYSGVFLCALALILLTVKRIKLNAFRDGKRIVGGTIRD